MSYPFPVPSWSGTGTVSGRVLTCTSGAPFYDGYPGAGLLFEIDPSVMTNIEFINLKDPVLIDFNAIPHKFKIGFETWFIDSTHLALGLDATYDLLIPAGTSGIFSAVEWPGFRAATCWASGNDVTSSPGSGVVAANPAIQFGGAPFVAPGSLTYARIFLNNVEYSVSAVNSATDLTVAGGSFPLPGTSGLGGAPVTAIWQPWAQP